MLGVRDCLKSNSRGVEDDDDLTKEVVALKYLQKSNKEQMDKLAVFRQKVNAMGFDKERYDDIYLLRFCRARKFEMEKVFLM